MITPTAIAALINNASYSVTWSRGSWGQKDVDAMEQRINQVHLTADQVAAAMQLIPEDEFALDADDVPLAHKLALWIGVDAAGEIMARVRWTENNPHGIWAPECAGIKMEI